MVYDVTNRESFGSIENWLNELKKYSTNHDLIKILVGNKCDMLDKRVVRKEEGMICAQKHHMMFIETSAKTCEGVACAYQALVEKIIQTPELWEKSDARKGATHQLRTNTDQAQGAASSCQGYCVI